MCCDVMAVMCFAVTHRTATQEIAVNLLLPNKYTGYVYLVDKYNRVRWRGCGLTLTSGGGGDGEVVQDEIQNLIRCTKELLREK